MEIRLARIDAGKRRTDDVPTGGSSVVCTGKQLQIRYASIGYIDQGLRDLSACINGACVAALFKGRYS
jgi:hypothetical protein